MGTWQTPPLSGSDFTSDKGDPPSAFAPDTSQPSAFIPEPSSPVDFVSSPGEFSDFEEGACSPTVDFMQGPPGPVGPMGPAGPPGERGPIGNRWWSGDGSPGTIIGSAVGDYYLDRITGDVYELTPRGFILANTEALI